MIETGDSPHRALTKHLAKGYNIGNFQHGIERLYPVNGSTRSIQYTVARLLDFGDEKKGIPSSYEFLRVCVPESEFQLWKGYPKYDAETNSYIITR